VPARLLRVALTGGLATGKSYCLDAFARLGVPVIDADSLARAAVAPGADGLTRVAERFGPGVISADGSLDREALGRIVFSDAAARRDLEAIVHPVVFAGIEQWFTGLEQDRASGRNAAPGVAIAEVPLLYETGHASDFDRVIVAACDPEEQKRRAIARGGLSEAEAERRMAAQIPIAEKRRRADYVVDTGGTLADTDRQVGQVLEQLRALK
jgi:dephospho-CoA kinase